MNGWLSKDGDFIPCEHMQHDNIAKERFGLTEQGMYREGFIKVFTAFGYTDISSTRFLTDAQKAWIEENTSIII
jgi:hypothetical protein